MKRTKESSLFFQYFNLVTRSTRPQKQQWRGGHRNQSASLQLHGRIWCWQKAEKPEQLVLPASSNCKYSKQLHHMGEIYSLHEFKQTWQHRWQIGVIHTRSPHV